MSRLIHRLAPRGSVRVAQQRFDETDFESSSKTQKRDEVDLCLVLRASWDLRAPALG